MSNEQNSSPSEENRGLSRDLGLFSITMMGLGAMIGAGIFVLIGIATGLAGPGVILAFALNGLVALIVGSAYAELGSAMPRAGGVYQWAKEIPKPFVGFMSGWVSWFGHAVACSLYALGFGSFATELLRLGLGALPVERILLVNALAAAVVLVFVCVNLIGASEASLAENIVTSFKVIILLVLIGFGMAQVFAEPRPLSDYQPFLPEGFFGVVVAMGLTFIAFEGYEIITQSGEEVRNPARNIPRAIFISIGVAVPIYVLVAFVLLGGVTPPGDQSVPAYLGSLEELGLAAAAGQLMPYGYVVTLIAGMASTASALNATIFSSSRVAFAIGRDRKLPGVFGRVGSRTEAPSRSHPGERRDHPGHGPLFAHPGRGRQRQHHVPALVRSGELLGHRPAKGATRDGAPVQDAPHPLPALDRHRDQRDPGLYPLRAQPHRLGQRPGLAGAGPPHLPDLQPKARAPGGGFGIGLIARPSCS